MTTANSEPNRFDIDPHLRDPTSSLAGQPDSDLRSIGGNAQPCKLGAPLDYCLFGKLAKSGRLDGKAGLSPRTIGALNHLFSQTLVDAQVQGRVIKNVSIGVTLPAATRPDLQFWSAEEVRHFLEGVRGDRDCALYYLDLSNGMRCAELLGVKWARTDMDIGELKIVETVVPVNHQPM